MNIDIKQATLSHVKEIAELFNSYRVFYGQKSNVDLAIKFIADRIKNEESIIFLAMDETGNSLGFTQLYPTFSSVSAQRVWVLNDLFVSASSRRLGVGEKLMNAAKVFALETDSKGISLETEKNNISAQALYETLGYERNSDSYHYFLKLTKV